MEYQNRGNVFPWTDAKLLCQYYGFRWTIAYESFAYQFVAPLSPNTFTTYNASNGTVPIFAQVPVNSKPPTQVDLKFVQEQIFAQFNGIGDSSDISGM